MDITIKKTLGVLLALTATHALAGSGNLFNVTTSGASLEQTVGYTLCLNINGKNPISCQNYSTSQSSLSIKTTAPNHTYHYAGIKINTPGYVYTAVPGLVRSADSRTSITSDGYTPLGPVSNLQAVSGNINSTTTLTYTNIYVETNNNLVTYSADNGADWGYMLSPQGGWSLNNTTWAIATTSNGTMYQATGGQGTGAAGSGAATLIYSSDGVNWSQVATFPTNDDWVQSVFAVGNTIYVGTGNGYVYFSSNNGATWSSSVTPAQVPDSSTVNAIVVDANGVFYAGTAGGNIYYSQNSGQSWTSLPNQPSTGVSISSLAIDTNSALYAVTANTTTQPQYNTAPLTTGTWQSMTALPGGNGDATTIAATGTTVYVGTSNSHVMYTSDKGVTWAGNQIPNDFSGITSLFVTQNILSPLFVESYGIMPLTSSQGTSTVTIKNLSGITVSNVQADSTQLPANVTQTSSPCTSVAPGGTCDITFTANGTNGFTPIAFNIIDNNKNTISRTALVSSITPNGGTNYYYVYNVNGGIASVIDAGNVSNGIIWGSNGTTVDYTSIWGIAENSTTTVPYPNATQPAGQTATQYTAQQNCNAATDGACDSTNVYIYYNNFIAGHPIPTADYAEGLCYANTHGGTPGTGQWYLPSACELNGGIYFNLTTHQFVSCSPVPTSYFSLYSLGALGGPLSSLLSAGYYWSSTEQSFSPQYYVWGQFFVSGGGGNQGGNTKGTLGGIRCSQALTI